MMLSKEAVEEYREIYKKEFGEEISYAEAEEQGSRLLNFLKIICKPIPKTKEQTPWVFLLKKHGNN